MSIREAAPADRDEWSRMRRTLWPDCDDAASRAEMEVIAAAGDQVALLAFDAAGVAIGFAELSIHPQAVGCRTANVGYLEGWWVDADHRRRGVGAALLEAGIGWARERGCKELASDTWHDNAVSKEAHRALGFVEAERLIHYRMDLDAAV